MSIWQESKVWSGSTKSSHSEATTASLIAHSISSPSRRTEYTIDEISASCVRVPEKVSITIARSPTLFGWLWLIVISAKRISHDEKSREVRTRSLVTTALCKDQ